MKERLHVIKRDMRWVVKEAGFGGVVRIYIRKENAIQYALSIKDKDVVVHRDDGTVMKILESGFKKPTRVELLEL